MGRGGGREPGSVSAGRPALSGSLEWPTECPDITASVEWFIPTSILLRDLDWSDEPDILVDRDQHEFSGFITAIYMAESVENLDWGRLKVIAGRTFFQPPSLPDEDEARFEMMAALGKGLPLEGRAWLLAANAASRNERPGHCRRP